MGEPENISATEFALAWHDVKDKDSGWVFYRLPMTSEVLFTGGKLTRNSIDKTIGSGFVIAPFYDQQKELWHIENTLHHKLIDHDFSKLVFEFEPFRQTIKNEIVSSKENYEKLVRDIIVEIEKGTMKKAVPARAKKISLKESFSPFTLFESLLKSYPNAFVYILSTPQTGTWIGCTPEKLLQVDKNLISTMSLAGTKKTSEAGSQNFSAKETEEQDIVTRYIDAILRNFCTNVVSDGPHSVTAGNVTHLATNFTGELKQEYIGNYMPILKDLHPTPAVCGIPLNQARNFLLEHEEFDRSLYSGFMGPMSDHKADIFVNLRCMQLFNQSALLYAGAGIVSGSIPENEWLETEEKMNTLLRFL